MKVLRNQSETLFLDFKDVLRVDGYLTDETIRNMEKSGILLLNSEMNAKWLLDRPDIDVNLIEEIV